VILLALFACTGADPADLVFENGTIHVTSVSSTTALAVRDGVVVAVGEEASELVGEGTDVVNLAGSTVTPGFHDAHTHLLPGGFVMERILLLGVSSMERVLTKVDDYASEHPEEPWIIGYGWTTGDLVDPDGRLIDAIVPDKPVALINGSGHSALVNSHALELAGIDADTPNPEGGTIVRDESGEATGLLLETAMGLVIPLALDAYDDEAVLQPLRENLDEFSGGGLTSISEVLAAPGVDVSRPWLYNELDADRLLPLRVHYYRPVFEQADLAIIDAERGDYESDLVRFAGAKIWVDGSLGSLEGWVESPYATSGTTGSAYFTAETLEAIVLEAEERNMPLKLHAMGDAAINRSLDALEAVSEVRGGLDQQHTLDHFVLADGAARSRAAALGLVISMQPAHYATAALADWHHELDDWGLDDGYDWGTAADEGLPVALGTDWPVWPTANFQVTMWAAVSNHGDRSLTSQQALKGFTADSAQSVGMGGELGCLEVGCLADIVMLDTDVLVAEPNDISGAEIEGVWVGGRQVR